MNSVFVLGVDPGDAHTGAAYWETGDRGVRCEEIPSDVAVAEINATLKKAVESCYDVRLVIEAFQLYADKASVQIGSSMETSQMIGALKYAASLLAVPVTEQGALIKKATRAQLKARGIKLSGSIHAKDAGLHTAHYVLYQNLGLR